MMSTQNVIRGLSGQGLELILRLAESGQQLFTIEDAQAILKWTDRNSLRVLLSRLGRGGWIRRIEKGSYLLVPLEAGIERHWSIEGLVLATQIIQPSAIAYWSALMHWNLSEQLPHTVFVMTPKRVRQRKQEYLGIRVQIITVLEKKFIGIRRFWLGNHRVPITDREKTVLDGLDHPEYCGGIVEVAKALWNAGSQLDFDRLEEYAEKMENQTVFKRLGYLVETLQLEIPQRDHCLERWHRQISRGISLLDPNGPRTGAIHTRWRLRINRDPKALLSWRGH